MRYRAYTLIFCCLLLAHVVHGQDSLAEGAGWDLARCIDYALSHNITVKQNELNQETAENDFSQSKFSRLPSVTASGSESLIRGTTTDPITYNFVSQTVRSTSVALNAQMTLYGGNEINNTIKQNSLEVDQYKFYTEEARNNITLEVAQAYLQAWYYFKGIDIAQYDLEASEKQLQQTTALREAGSATTKDVADMKSQYATSKYDLVAAQNSYDAQVVTLKQLLEFNPGQEFNLVFPDTVTTLVLGIPEKLTVYSIAVENLPEIRAAKLQEQIKALDVSIAKAAGRPTLSLSGGLSTGYTNTQDYDFGKQFDNNYSQRVVVSLSIPIFSQFSTRTSIQNAFITKQGASLDLVSAKKTLYQEIENAWQSATASQSEMEAAREEVSATKLSYDLAQQQHKLGSLSTVDLLVDQNEYLSAQQKYNQTKYNLVLYYLLLEFYQGNPIKL